MTKRMTIICCQQTTTTLQQCAQKYKIDAGLWNQAYKYIQKRRKTRNIILTTFFFWCCVLIIRHATVNCILIARTKATPINVTNRS